MILRRRDSIERKTPEQFNSMRRAGLIVAEVHERLSREAAPGVTTLDLDRIAREILAAHGAAPSFLGYHGYPAVICASVNEQVVHGIPSDTPLAEGDVLSVDFGAIVQDSRGVGWHGDAAVTLLIGENIDAEDIALSDATREGLWAGLAATAPGIKLGDLGATIERTIRAKGPYGILTDYVGHGIGTSMHMAPDVPNVGSPGRGMTLTDGMAIAIEPMVTRGTHETEVLEDDWTVITRDGSRAAHWEHTVAITEQGPWVLTAADGGAAAFAALGVASPAAERG
jgi:methionyl aminopeptidase